MKDLSYKKQGEFDQGRSSKKQPTGYHQRTASHLGVFELRQASHGECFLTWSFFLVGKNSNKRPTIERAGASFDFCFSAMFQRHNQRFVLAPKNENQVTTWARLGVAQT